VPLAGKIALLTGARRGIGRAIAQQLARDGATVIAHYSGSRSGAGEVVKDTRLNGEAPSYIRPTSAVSRRSYEYSRRSTASLARSVIPLENSALKPDLESCRMSEPKCPHKKTTFWDPARSSGHYLPPRSILGIPDKPADHCHGLNLPPDAVL
jgi:hypothetical protein